MKVRITMEFTKEQMEAISISDDMRDDIARFMLTAVEDALPAVMGEYRRKQVIELRKQITELEADDFEHNRTDG